MGGENDDVSKRFQDMCLLMSADSERLSCIWNYLKNNTLLGTYNYPKTPTATYDILCRYKNPTLPLQTHAPPGAVIFFQNDGTGSKTVPGNYG